MTMASMHRILAIPELLDTIFSFMANHDNVSNACVCRRWSNIALDVLWRDVRDLRPLLQLLAPLDNTRLRIKFTRSVLPNDWERFDKYASRVRRLLLDSSSAIICVFREEMFDEIARTRPRLEILPRLHTLNWGLDPAPSIIFMHKNIKRFEVMLPFSMIYAKFSFATFLPTISARMPNLEVLLITTDISVKVLEDEACSLIRNLPKLKKITLPRFHLTTHITEELARLHDLGTVQFEYYDVETVDAKTRRPEDIQDFSPALDDTSFPALFDYSPCLPFSRAAQFFGEVFSPRNLTILYLDSPELEHRDSIARIISVVAEHCQVLEKLTLNPFVQLGDVEDDPAPFVDFDTLRPILRCPNLVYLEMHHHVSFQISIQNIEEIASAWPSLETLILNNDPLPNPHNPPPLPLQALSPFAQHCPRLKLLGLYMDASETSFPPAYDTIPFKALETLSVGLSPIGDPGPVALFLSQMCPLGCELEMGVTWHDAVHEGTEEHLVSTCTAWKKVGELLPLLTKMRMEERERTRLLKAEVEDLRIRTDILMAKMPPTSKDALGCTPF